MSDGSAFHRVGVVVKRGSAEALATARELAEWLKRRDLEVEIDEESAVDGEEPSDDPESLAAASRPLAIAVEKCDLMVVLGGDGTLLSVARRLAGGTPILGVNLGRLGFLTEIHRAELYPSLVEVLAGRFQLEPRSLLDVELVRADGNVQTYRALNDVVIAKSALARIIEMQIAVDGRLVARYRCDGLILSTPTGSTAYNLSAGGPILHPQLAVTLLTPICPHTLSLRPIAVPDTATIDVTLDTRREKVYLTVDGQEGTELEYRDRVHAVHAAARVQLIRVSGRGFFDGLRGKLHWGE